MQRDNRNQSPDSPRDDSSPRAREDSSSRQGGIGERGASTQRTQPAPSGGAMQQPSAAGQGSQQYGVAPRGRDFGYPSLFGGGGPFALLRRMEQEMDRMFEQFGVGRGELFGSQATPSLWSPQVEMYERDGKLHICTDLPGMRKEDIQVNLEDDVLTIQGERRSSHQDQQRQGFYRSERSYGSFYRSIALPEGVKAENAQATFRDGVLDIAFDAPAQQRRGRRLEITEDSSAQSGAPESGRSTGGASGSTPQR